eukprot:750529-Rhodomonas_salina.2
MEMMKKVADTLDEMETIVRIAMKNAGCVFMPNPVANENLMIHWLGSGLTFISFAAHLVSNEETRMIMTGAKDLYITGARIWLASVPKPNTVSGKISMLHAPMGLIRAGGGNIVTGINYGIRNILATLVAKPIAIWFDEFGSVRDQGLVRVNWFQAPLRFMMCNDGKTEDVMTFWRDEGCVMRDSPVRSMNLLQIKPDWSTINLATSCAHEEVQPRVEGQAEGPDSNLDTLGDHSDTVTDDSGKSELPDINDAGERGGVMQSSSTCWSTLGRTERRTSSTQWNEDSASTCQAKTPGQDMR